MPTTLSSKVLLSVVLVAALAVPTSASAQSWGIRPDTHAQTIQRVTNMPMDATLQRRAQALGLNVVNVMWEDTGRFQGSSVGPNISDVTLQVRENVAGGVRTHLLPVIRHPNFTDRTADVRADQLWVRVGNQRDERELYAVPLTEVLANMKAYLSDSSSLLGDGNFLAERDSHFLVSAQHVFVPLSSRGTAEFNPVLYNYQSAPGSPAVLTLLVTRQGTSATIIENASGDQTWQGWGQQLFFNHEGQRTVFTAERRSAVQARIERGHAGSQDTGALDEGADMMMIVQVPLKHANRGWFFGDGEGAMEEAMPAPSAAASGGMERRSTGSYVEQAVIAHGDDLGPFREMGGLRLERDERFPVRVTVQFYRATSNGIISAQDLRDVHDQIERVYADGDFVGSLVVPESGRTRPTEWTRIRRLFMPAPIVATPPATPVVTPVAGPVATPAVPPVVAAPATPAPFAMPSLSDLFRMTVLGRAAEMLDLL